MSNSMVDASQCGGDKEVRVEGNNEGGIRLPARVEVVGGRYPAIYNSRSSSSEVDFPMKKSEDGNFANLGPDTKETELTLGLPELGSRGGSKAFIPRGKLPDLGILQGGRIYQNLPASQLNALVPRCSLDFQVRANSIYGPEYASKEEFKLKPIFREFTTPNLPLFPLVPRLPAKRNFSETLTVPANGGNASGEPKPSATKFCMPPPWPASLFNFPSSAGGPQNVWSMNQRGAYGQVSGHMGPNEIKTNESALSINPPSAAQIGNPAEFQTSTGTPSEQRAAPARGWPPVRSSRRNLTPQQTMAPAADADAPPPPPPVQPPPPPPRVAQPITMFVKVNVEGVPFGRKIDLNVYNSYEELSVGLDEMFKKSIPCPFSLRNGDYMLVYEDDEGDRMLVGDVPWRMFVTTVKRLRMIRRSEARGLGIHGARAIRGQLDREPV